jgi:hypothetical protein
VLVSRFDHYDLGMVPSFHMLGLRNSLRSDRLRMLQDFITHLVLIQTVDQSLRYFHEQPPRNKTITFLMYLYFSDEL